MIKKRVLISMKMKLNMYICKLLNKINRTAVLCSLLIGRLKIREENYKNLKGFYTQISLKWL